VAHVARMGHLRNGHKFEETQLITTLTTNALFEIAQTLCKWILS